MKTGTLLLEIDLCENGYLVRTNLRGEQKAKLYVFHNIAEFTDGIRSLLIDHERKGENIEY